MTLVSYLFLLTIPSSAEYRVGHTCNISILDFDIFLVNSHKWTICFGHLIYRLLAYWPGR